MLATNYYVVKEATQIPLNCYESLLGTKKQLAIFLSVAGRLSRLTDARQELEWSLQLIDFLTVATKLQSGSLRPALKGELMDVNTIQRFAHRLL